MIGSGVVWFTGLPDSGKTTLARAVEDLLLVRGARVERLDGDELRRRFPGTGFGRASRDEHVLRAGKMAAELECQGALVLCSLVSPYQSSRAAVRALCRRFIEVHVSTSLTICQARDTKGLYGRAQRGELHDLTGVGDPYEAPSAPELELDCGSLTPIHAAEKVIDHLARFV